MFRTVDDAIEYLKASAKSDDEKIMVALALAHDVHDLLEKAKAPRTLVDSADALHSDISNHLYPDW